MFGMMALMSEDDSDSNGGADETKDDNNAPMCQARPAATEWSYKCEFCIEMRDAVYQPSLDIEESYFSKCSLFFGKNYF